MFETFTPKILTDTSMLLSVFYSYNYQLILFISYSDEQDDQNTMRIQKTLAFDNAEYSGDTADNQQNKISVIYENLRVF